MSVALPKEQKERLVLLFDFAWEVFLERVASGRIKINKESSMQLHLGVLLHNLGELLCTQPNEALVVELESIVDGQNVDVTCALGEVKGALELKCFRKSSKRAVDTDMYDVLKDIERLQGYQDFAVRRFICLTDNSYYVKAAHSGHAGSVSIRDGVQYRKGTTISPSWSNQWKDKSRDRPLRIENDVCFHWEQRGNWYALNQWV